MEREKEIEIQTRLGLRRIDTEKIITFPHGLAGFEHEHEFILLQIRPEAPMLILQSVSTPAIGLLVADPFCFLPDHKIVVGDAEQKMLGITQREDAAYLVTVTIPAGRPEKAALNLAGPIVINHRQHIGMQVPQNCDGPTQVNMHTLKPVTPEEQAETELQLKGDDGGNGN